MAQTYTIGEALTLVSRQLGRSVEDDYGAYIANIAMNTMWNRYDWRETIAQLPPFYLIGNEQEFGPPSAIVPANFLGLREAYLVGTTAVPARRMELKVRRDLRLTGAQGLPAEISYDPTTKRFRVFPRVPNGIGATDYLIDGTYKIKPTKILPNTLSSTLIPWDDVYFQAFVAALKWAAWDVATDPRATNQFGVMTALVDDMAEAEGLNLGDPAIAPSEPLIYPNQYGFLFPGLG
jgi:hypothetical protein